jgi:TerB N-terminal domain
VFLFYYGLERRLLSGECRTHERCDLIAEIERLRTVYGGHSSFNDYSMRLLDFLTAEEYENLVSDPARYEPPAPQRSWEQPYCSGLRAGLANLSATFYNVPAAWALSWAQSHRGFRERNAAKRCRAEFEQLFALKYDNSFPEGVVLPRTGPKLTLHYRPASPSFRQPITGYSTLADITAFDEPANTLKELAMQCVEQLDAFSRLRGRHPGAENSGAALALLPTPLFEDRVQKTAPDLLRWLDTTLEPSFPSVALGTLLARCSMLDSNLPSGKKAELAVILLERMGVAVEPDPRHALGK